jgi:Uncharacterized protein conserved in bacteria
MKAGIEVALDELCLPMKIFLGHVRTLATHVDYIMVPHLIKVESDAFICPKFMGLPDIVCHAVPAIKEKLLIVQVGPTQVDMLASLRHAAKHLQAQGKFERLSNSSVHSPMIKSSYFEMMNKPALMAIEDYQSQVEIASSIGLTIGLLGHPYCLYDACLNLSLLQILTDLGANFLTPEMMPLDLKGLGAGKLAKKLFWTTGQVQFDALEWMLQANANHNGIEVDGFIQIAPFACGPEAIVSDMVERRIKKAKKPYIKIYYEEQSGEAGVITRVEAFLDLIKYQHIAC